MTIEAVDGCGDEFDVMEMDEEGTTWNGREISVGGRDLLLALQMVSLQYCLWRHRHVEQLDLNEEQPRFLFAATHPLNDYVFDELNNIFDPNQCGFWKSTWNKVKKTAKKVGKAVEKVVNSIAHGVKNAAKETADFVKEHKKEVLIAAAVIAVVAGAYAASGLLIGGAAAAPPQPGRKDDDTEPEPTGTTSDPPLPDWAKNILESTIPDFSLANATQASLDEARKGAHDAWNEIHKLGQTNSIDTVLNTLFGDAQKSESYQAFVNSQGWENFIHQGHDKIDQAFSAASDKIKPPVPPSLFDKVKLGLDIIGQGMNDMKLFDPQSPLSLYSNSPFQNPNQSISEYLENVENALKAHPAPFENSPTPVTPKSYALDAPPTEPQFKSRHFKTEGPSQDGMLITSINGMLNSYEEAFSNAEYIRALCPGNPSIEGVYNHSNGPLDLLEVFLLNYKWNSPVTQDLLREQWTKFHENNQERPNAKILHFCYSQGAIHTRNALARLPEEVRKRMIVVAIAPAAVVPNALCFKSYNYASEKDIVPYGELLANYWQANGLGDAEREEMLMNISKIHNELILLKPHDMSSMLDHDFQSPTFNQMIKTLLRDYIGTNGEYQ